MTVKYVTKPVAYVCKGYMDEIMAVYKRGGFNINDINCDNEFAK